MLQKPSPLLRILSSLVEMANRDEMRDDYILSRDFHAVVR